MMQPTKGYYSLIQYCPDAGRLEAANVGVLLFCPEQSFLQAKTVLSNRRIIKFFGTEGHDWARINSFKRGLEERLKVEFGEINSLESLEQFIALRANYLQITPPRSMQVTNPIKDLEALFIEIIGEEAPKHTSTKTLKRLLKEKIVNAGLEEKVRSDFEVEVPITRKKLEIPVGFQNGRFNLVNPVRFETEEPQQAFNTACRYAVEGESLFNHAHPSLGELQLVVVGKFRANDKESPAMVKKVLTDHHVKLYRFSKLLDLIDEIRRTAKTLPR
ncbi:MAG TPA: DUF3037 domain-containing protein [Pirellulales bacterium]|jgi:hypothetical protein|nr:DUF3037 domain-containing protein [Pirellulales bacterium]